MSPRYGEVNTGYGRRLASTAPDEDGPVWMVNLMSYRREADYADGRDSTISGLEADDLYTPTAPLAAVGAEIVFVAEVEDQLLGAEPNWDRVAVVKYPTRRSFIDMQQRDDFQRLHEHKDAGMAKTIVMGTQPMLGSNWGVFDLPDWKEVPHPPTTDDGEVMVVHVLSFHDNVGAQSPAGMESYSKHAGQVAAPHGARVEGWFAVEGTIIGDGRRWDQVRFNTFPSRRAFMAVVMDPDRLTAQNEYREPAIADTYALVTRPTVNGLAASVDHQERP